MASRAFLLTLTICSAVTLPLECVAANDLGVTADRTQAIAPSSRRHAVVKPQELKVAANVSASETTRVVTGSGHDAAIVSSPRISPASDNLRPLMRRLMATVACIAALCFAIVLGGKLQQANSNSNPAGQLQLISTLKIAPRCCLSLVAANGQSFLIARDAGGVKNIVPIERSFDSYVLDDLGETTWPTPQSDDRPS